MSCADVIREFLDEIESSGRVYTIETLRSLIDASTALVRVGLVEPGDAAVLVARAKHLQGRLTAAYTTGFSDAVSTAPDGSVDAMKPASEGASTDQYPAPPKGGAGWSRDTPSKPMFVIGTVEELQGGTVTLLAVELWSGHITLRFAGRSEDRDSIDWEAWDDTGVLYLGRRSSGRLQEGVWVQEWIFIPRLEPSATSLHFALFSSGLELAKVRIDVPTSH